MHQDKAERSKGMTVKADIASNSVQRQRILDVVFAFLGLFLSAYLIWPAFNAVHLEGFTAQTESIAIMLSRAPDMEHDPYLPVVSQFIYQTRSAVVDTLTLIYQLSPGTGDYAFQGLVLASFFLLVATSIVFAKRWGNVPPLFAFFGLILTPGIPETAFFLNDNIISAAFATVALALISEKPKKLKWIFSGIFLGIAILSRVDAVFVLPLIIGTVFYSYKQYRDRITACFIICLATFILLFASAILHGFSLFDVFITAKKFVMNVDDKAGWFWVRILFFGLGTLPLLVLGGWLSFRRFKNQRSYIGLLTFIGYPALLALLAPKATEIRYIFPLLSPIIALHVGRGLKWVYEQYILSGTRPSRYAIGVTIFAMLVAVFPPTLLKMRDGPRALLGRLWSPILWSHWQASVDESMKRSVRLARLLDNQQLNILISTHYNDEFYLRLRLIEAGFVPVATSSAYPGCNGFSLFKKGNSTVVHIRTDPQYKIAPVSMVYNAAMQISAAFSCQAISSFDKVYVSTFGNNEYGIPSKIYSFSPYSFDKPINVEFDDIRSRLTPDNPNLRRDYGILGFRQLSTEEIQTTRLKAKSYLSSFPERDPDTGKVVTIEDYGKYYLPVSGPTSNLLLELRDMTSFETR
jgi:hypothetical protein